MNKKVILYSVFLLFLSFTLASSSNTSFEIDSGLEEGVENMHFIAVAIKLIAIILVLFIIYNLYNSHQIKKKSKRTVRKKK
jgi:hypothetical protein